jgi:4-diphosphocytidyl-2-C-methyl-D-erythritol kinase
MPSAHAAAKINLFLHVTGKREDGYHLLDSLVVFTATGDDVCVEAADLVSLTIDGPFGAGLPTDARNLVMQAAQLMKHTYKIKQGAKIHLTKRLPLASGIGGGSSDAAATMHSLNTLWGINADKNELSTLALQLGADLPMCIHHRTAHVTGIGDVITPLSGTEELHLVLINCGQAVSSADIFSAGVEHQSGAVKDLDITNGIAPAIKGLHNDLATAAIAHAPEIQSTLDALNAINGCTLARMSGSGATCFGLFNNAKEAAAGAATLQAAFPNWWVISTQTA